jgi:hypothetical protein
VLYIFLYVSDGGKSKNAGGEYFIIFPREIQPSLFQGCAELLSFFYDPLLYHKNLEGDCSSSSDGGGFGNVNSPFIFFRLKVPTLNEKKTGTNKAIKENFQHSNHEMIINQNTKSE